MPNLSHLAHKLAQHMQDSLPGPRAQQAMAPQPRRNNPQAEARALRQAGVLLLLYLRQDRLHIPLIVRPEYDGPHSGQVALPGGRRERGDPDLWHTAMREAEEEIGMPSHAVAQIGQLTPLYIPNSHYMVTPFLAWQTQPHAFVPDPNEVRQILEIPVQQLQDPARIQRETWLIRGREVDVPYYAIQDFPVWGATAMILAEFLRLLATEPASQCLV